MGCRLGCWNGEGSFLVCWIGESSFILGRGRAWGLGEASFLTCLDGTTSTTEVDFWILSEPTIFISIMESDF